MAAAELAKEITETQKDTLHKLIEKKTYAQQAVHFLNAFWPELEAKDPNLKEVIFGWIDKMNQIDDPSGHSLDEHQAHRFWEAIGGALTVIAMRQKLRTVDLDCDKRMSFLEFALCKNDSAHFSEACYTVTECLTRSQGTNEAMEKALADVAKLTDMSEAARKKEEDILAAIEKFKGKVVKQNRAKNELAQHRDRDMTSFNQALITAQAAVRKAQNNSSLVAMGAKWWVERELQEALKYKPKGDLRTR